MWIMARIPGDPAEIVAGDTVDRYVLMCHGHDGSLALRAGFNPVRVVCQNTLSLALDSGDGMVCLRHTSGLPAGLARLRKVISEQIGIFNGTTDAWRLLAARSCSDIDFDAYALRLFALARGEGDDAVRVIEPDATVGRRLLEDVRPLFEAGVGNDRKGVRGTWWAAYNAVTEWLTHHRGSTAGTEREQAERRFDSLHLGPGRRLGVRALMLALDAARRGLGQGAARPSAGAACRGIPAERALAKGIAARARAEKAQARQATRDAALRTRAEAKAAAASAATWKNRWSATKSGAGSMASSMSGVGMGPGVEWAAKAGAIIGAAVIAALSAGVGSAVFGGINDNIKQEQFRGQTATALQLFDFNAVDQQGQQVSAADQFAENLSNAKWYQQELVRIADASPGDQEQVGDLSNAAPIIALAHRIQVNVPEDFWTQTIVPPAAVCAAITKPV